MNQTYHTRYEHKTEEKNKDTSLYHHVLIHGTSGISNRNTQQTSVIDKKTILNRHQSEAEASGKYGISKIAALATGEHRKIPEITQTPVKGYPSNTFPLRGNPEPYNLSS